MNKKIFLASPHMSDEGWEKEYINEAFATNWLAPLGKNVDMFEQELKEYVSVDSALALSSGTSAIHLAVKLAGVKKGDYVFCSSLTFLATINPVIYEGGIPVFIDSEKDSYNMAPEALKKAFCKYNPKAVIVVHLYGQAANIQEIVKICESHNVVLIEDAAESLGSTVDGQYTGTFGKYGIFSFNGNKIITTSGGGMLVSNDSEGIEKARFWSTQAREKCRHYEHKEIGYNYRMSNVLAGIGRGQLKVLKDRIEKKNEIFNMYKKAFNDIKDIYMQDIPLNVRANCWLSTILLDKNSSINPLDIILELEKNNIESRPIWKPMHMQPVFQGTDFIKIGDEAVCEDIFSRGVCLPSDTNMTKEEQQQVIDIIRALWSK